jgi:hypothetical protein
MDPLTHTLSGLAVAHAGFRQRIGRPAVLAIAVLYLALAAGAKAVAETRFAAELGQRVIATE